MILYITSSPCIDGADRAILNPQNGFLLERNKRNKTSLKGSLILLPN